MNRDNHFGVDVFDVFGSIGDFGPRGGNWYTEDLGMFNRRIVKGIAGVGEDVVYDYTEVIARDLAFDNRSMGLAEKLNFEATNLASFTRADNDRTTDKGRSIWSSEDCG